MGSPLPPPCLRECVMDITGCLCTQRGICHVAWSGQPADAFTRCSGRSIDSIA